MLYRGTIAFDDPDEIPRVVKSRETKNLEERARMRRNRSDYPEYYRELTRQSMRRFRLRKMARQALV
jgi:hypothetical protein